ncbi:uncharacterized protein LOC131957473 [Physella acuta]|uniref:uncharacterized protein LOC131957473 n=1 Tax=Physella acuta TaxID=109671 RepID=UPI0027DD63E4|nr:uncharacterized protein LOC131957473 [Physella acuta]
MHFSELSDKYEGMHNYQVDKSETMKKSEYKIGTEVQEPQREITIRELASEELEQLKSKLDSNIQKVDITAFPNSKEQFTKQLMQSQPPPPRNDNAQPNSRRGSRQRQEEMRLPLDDGWNTVASKSLRIDASKMRLSKNVVDENSIQLGPGGGTNKFSMWSRGSYGGAQPSTDDRPAPATNRFSLLRGEEDRRNFQRSPSRGDSVSKSTIIGGKIVEM